MSVAALLASTLFSEGKPTFPCINRETNGDFKW